jgi:hypothetical protein
MKHSGYYVLLILNTHNFVHIFLGAFGKLRKVTISFNMSVSPSAHMEQLGSHRKDFNEIWYLSIIRGSVEKIQVSLKMTRITGTLHEDLCTFMIISP